MIDRQKPGKPYPEFPLTAHQNGQWVKKIKGRLHYFGPWEPWQDALDLYLSERDELYAGRRPSRSNGPTLGEAMNQFLSSKKLLEQAGELSHRSYLDYERTCDRIEASLKKQTLVADISVSHLEQLRTALGTGLRGKLSPTTLKGDLTRARCLFLYINEFIADKAIPYRKPLKSPSKQQFRKIANARGPRMFEAGEIRKMIEAAPVTLRAMIYLGINCGFGNSDCGQLPFAHVDLEKGWHNFWRPKTHNSRRCPLWPETIAAIRASLETRPEPADETCRDYVFLTSEGKCWAKIEKSDNSISSELRKLLKSLKLYRKNVTTFYSLRRTFETIGATAGEQIAVDYIMGHIANDMAAIYRQKTFDQPLRKVTEHVRAWLLGKIKIE